jgi:hypothetical protein
MARLSGFNIEFYVIDAYCLSAHDLRAALRSNAL